MFGNLQQKCCLLFIEFKNARVGIHLTSDHSSLSEMKCQKEGQNYPSFIIVYSLLIVNLFLVLFSLF